MLSLRSWPKKAYLSGCGRGATNSSSVSRWSQTQGETAGSQSGLQVALQVVNMIEASAWDRFWDEAAHTRKAPGDSWRFRGRRAWVGMYESPGVVVRRLFICSALIRHGQLL